MKQRNTWKMRLSVLLMVVMMLNMTITAFAEWREEDGGWRYYNQDGNMVKNKEKKIRGQWFSFDEDGFMRTGWLEHLGGGKSFYTVPPTNNIAENQWVLIDGDWYYFKGIIEGADGIEGGAVKAKPGSAQPKWKKIQGKYYCFNEEGKMYSKQFLDIDGRRHYAFEDGSLADRGWLLLGEKEDGSVAECWHTTDDCNCSWYHFKALTVEGDKLDGGVHKAEEGKIREQEIQGVTYAFDSNGRMFSREWNGKHYFQRNGDQAVNKYLLIGDTWYSFNGQGNGEVYTASGSDAAPCPAVSSITPVENNVSVMVGEKAEVSFKVNLASSTNAVKKELTKDHDFWITCTNGRTSNAAIADGNTYKMTYEAGKKADTERVYLWIDGVRSDPLNINVTLAKTEDGNDEVKPSEVGSVVDNILAGFDSNTVANADAEGAAASLKTAYSNDDVKNAMQTKLLDEAMKADNNNSLQALENKFVEDKKITLAAPAVSGEAEETMGDSEVSITGAALNASEGQTVQLEVNVPEEHPEIEGSYRNTIALDFTLNAYDVDGNLQSLEDLEIPVVISIKVPAGFTKSDKIFNLHDGEQLEVKFNIKNGKVYFVTDRFSTYVFAITDKPASNPSSGGGKNNVNSEIESAMKAGSQSGNWIQDATGWWFSMKDGSYPVNTWMYLDYNRVYKWYHFDMSGYIRTGWFTDNDGHIYYLNPISDGTKGAMLTGWQYIDGYWYYFNPTSDGTQGALLVNTTTPDGYVVNEKGQWVQ